MDRDNIEKGRDCLSQALIWTEGDSIDAELVDACVLQLSGGAPWGAVATILGIAISVLGLGVNYLVPRVWKDPLPKALQTTATVADFLGPLIAVVGIAALVPWQMPITVFSIGLFVLMVTVSLAFIGAVGAMWRARRS